MEKAIAQNAIVAQKSRGGKPFSCLLAVAIVGFAQPANAEVVFETQTGDTGVYTFGSPVESGEIATNNIGDATSYKAGRFAFRSGTVNVKEGGYVHLVGYEDSNIDHQRSYGNWLGVAGNSATVNVDGGVFWVDIGKANTANYPGCGRLRIGVNNYTQGRTGVSRLNLISGELRVDNVLMCGGSYYNSDDAKNTPAEMNMSGGTAVVNSFWLGAKTSGTYTNATFNLTGGEMQVNSFVFQPYHNQTFNWGTGTITAGAANVFTSLASAGGCTRTVNVTGNPAVFNTGNFAQTIPADIASGTGTLKLTGGNTVTLSAASSFGLCLDVGTALVVASTNYIGGGLVLTAPAEVPADGIYTVFAVSGDETLDGFTLPAAPENCALRLSADKKSILCVYGDPQNTWIGGASGSLSDYTGWSLGFVPTSGDSCVIGNATAASLTVGNLFAPSSITFAEGSAAVTINGEDLIGIVAVTNLSSSSHTINAKVYFDGDIQVKQAAMGGANDLEKAHVTFAGGAYAASGCSLESGDFEPIYSRYIFGRYNLASTSESRWRAVGYQGTRRVCVADDSYLYVPYAANLKDLWVCDGAKVDIGDMTNGVDRLFTRVYGEIVVTNLTVSGSSAKFMTWSQGTTTPGVFKFDSVTNAMTPTGDQYFYLADQYAASKHTFYIGAGGLNFNGNAKAMYVIGTSYEGNYETIRPWYSDITIANRSDSDNKFGLILCRNVEFCTDDESGVGRTITIDAVTRGSSSSQAKITVSGSGTLKVNRPANNGIQPPVTLKDSATLEYTTATATLGSGAMTLGAGTTFVFFNSGDALTLPSASAINLPSTGAATLRINGSRLKSGEHTILSDVTEGAASHLTVDSESPALAGRRSEVVEKDGNLVLTIIPPGTVIIVR